MATPIKYIKKVAEMTMGKISNKKDNPMSKKQVIEEIKLNMNNRGLVYHNQSDIEEVYKMMRKGKTKTASNIKKLNKLNDRNLSAITGKKIKGTGSMYKLRTKNK